MKRIMLVSIAACAIFFACRKNESLFSNHVQQILRDNLSAEDFSNVDFSRITQNKLPNSEKQLVRVGFKEKDLLHDCILLSLDANGKLINSRIMHIEGTANRPDSKTKPSFNGLIETSSLRREDKTSSVIVNGFIRSLHESKITVNGVRMNVECADCTIPEVIVSTSYNRGFDWTSVWMSIAWMFNDWPPNEYIAIDYSGGGGGGGGGSAPTTITIDTEAPENKAAIEPKKYTDCFGQISGNLATYSVTISADLPVDGHPETFFNWTDASPGHAYIELTKSNPYETVRQDIGFYPGTSYKVLSGQDINSKTVDDGGHEYNARYTITVTAAQFQAALDAVSANASHPYNVSYYNCTDFALAVFNAAGGNLTIPRHPIPNFGVPGGSNTPQGLYERISELSGSGTAGAAVAPGKEYAGSSKGPCN